ncbi:MAG: carboxypeptidase-like regulatory domain-containing protein [Acidobacteria bacterium]|nr:carboxypeptidase-like regulatory domain-containing protein [Acidobacteriota bacterium]MDA1233306.1 carboxypeptidase-like regulatory domain-containing protein [Acidobacteriota bacterium]
MGADCPGYRLISINGRRSALATYDCSQPGPCAQADLTLEPLAVIEGHVLDSNGMPVENIGVELRQSAAGSRSRFRRAVSDDRGYFRLFHLPPGDYDLVPQPGSGLAEGIEWKGDPQHLSLGPGDVISGAQVQLRLTQGVEISGRIEGLAPGTRQVTLLFQRPNSNSGRTFSKQVEVDEEGRFKLSGAQLGRYEVDLLLRNTQTPSGEMTRTYLGPVEIIPAGGGLTLAPREPVVLRGALNVEWPQRDDLPGVAEGAPVDLMATGEDGVRRRATAQPPDYRFEFLGLRPGSYRLTPSARGAKAERQVGDDQWEPLGEIALNGGDTVDLDLRVRFEFGRLSVLVRPPPGSRAAQAAHYVVGIRTDGVARLFPTDQNGLLAVNYIPSGDYEICAWPDISVDDANNSAIWRKAGDSVRKFRHDEGVDMEITLTATP